MSLVRFAKNKAVMALSVTLLSFFIIGQVASAISCTVTTRTGSNCTLDFTNPSKVSNMAYSRTKVVCSKPTNIRIKMKLQQLSILGIWSTVDTADSTSYTTLHLVDVSAGCRYGSYSNWRSYTEIYLDGVYTRGWETAGASGVSIPCSI